MAKSSHLLFSSVTFLFANVDKRGLIVGERMPREFSENSRLEVPASPTSQKQVH